MHAQNLARHPAYRLRYVVDVHEPAAREVAEATGAAVATTAQALAELDRTRRSIEAAARAGKAILCEKPIDCRARGSTPASRSRPRPVVPLMIGFNPALRCQLRSRSSGRSRAAAIGRLELVSITSRDPGPPPARLHRGLGRALSRLMIHDFDLARWLLGEEPAGVRRRQLPGRARDRPRSATSTPRCDPQTGSGGLGQISCSRRASYGYDQRSRSMAQGHGAAETSGCLRRDRRRGRLARRVLFIERYAAAYAAELDHFAACLRMASPSPVAARTAAARWLSPTPQSNPAHRAAPSRRC